MKKIKTKKVIAGVRHDRKTNQYVPTINGKDTSPTSFDEDRALRIAQEQIAYETRKDCKMNCLRKNC